MIWGIVFYATSALGGVMNKQLIKMPGAAPAAAAAGVDATTLTAAHLLFSVACDRTCVRAVTFVSWLDCLSSGVRARWRGPDYVQAADEQ